MVLSILSVAKVLPSPQRKDEPREIHLEAPLKEKEFCIKVVHYVGADKLIARIDMLDLHLFAASYLEVAETVQTVQSCVSYVIGDLASARLGWGYEPSRHHGQQSFRCLIVAGAPRLDGTTSCQDVTLRVKRSD